MATTLSLSEFRAAFPEFSKAPPDAQMNTFLDWAHAQTDPAVWGDDRSIGIGFLAAHYAAIAPRGQDMRLQREKGEPPTTFYEIEYKKWVRRKAGGPRTTTLKKEFNDIKNKINK